MSCGFLCTALPCSTCQDVQYHCYSSLTLLRGNKIIAFIIIIFSTLTCDPLWHIPFIAGTAWETL